MKSLTNKNIIVQTTSLSCTKETKSSSNEKNSYKLDRTSFKREKKLFKRDSHSRWNVVQTRQSFKMERRSSVTVIQDGTSFKRDSHSRWNVIQA